MALLDQLPEEVVSHVISLTTARDACVSCAVSHAFRSAADSDTTWQHLLPSDYASFLSRAVHPVAYASLKELYFQLCDHPLLIDGGLMSFGLEKSSGAKIFMISARRMSIVWGEDRRYWKWIALDDPRYWQLPLTNSRFEECAELRAVCWLEMCGKIKSEILTPNTSYAAYLIFNLKRYTTDLGNPFQKSEVSAAGDIVSRREKLCLNPRSAHEEITEDVILPTRRRDGWQEVELGVFYNGSGVEGEVCMYFKDLSSHWKRGLIVQGIEVRPRR